MGAGERDVSEDKKLHNTDDRKLGKKKLHDPTVCTKIIISLVEQYRKAW